MGTLRKRIYLEVSVQKSARMSSYKKEELCMIKCLKEICVLRVRMIGESIVRTQGVDVDTLKQEQ